jgi:hypothetical protein
MQLYFEKSKRSEKLLFKVTHIIIKILSHKKCNKCLMRVTSKLKLIVHMF